MDMFQAGSTWLQTQRKNYLSREITYCRQLLEIILDATASSAIMRVVDEYGRMIIVHTQDFIIEAADIATIGEPIPGDKIIDGAFVYEVVSVAGEPCFIYADHNHVVYRVRTKEAI